MNNTMYGPHRLESAADRLWVASLQAARGPDSRYVHRRAESPADAEADSFDAVFRTAVDERDTIPAHALPWFIATARSQCAQTLRRGQASSQAPIVPVSPGRRVATPKMWSP